MRIFDVFIGYVYHEHMLSESDTDCEYIQSETIYITDEKLQYINDIHCRTGCTGCKG